MKSEPDVYGIEDLKSEDSTLWDGIRNYQARNFMRSMEVNDQAFFYHSNCKPPGIVGLMKVIQIGLIDPTQFDKQSKYYDPKSTKENPRWDCVKLAYIGKFNKQITLEGLKNIYTPEELKVVKRGNRLSIMPISRETSTDLLKRLGDISK